MVMDELGAYCAAQGSTVLSDEVSHHAVRAVVDWMAATIAGGVMSPATNLTRAFVDDRGGNCELIPSGRRTDVRTAALINGSAAHTAELDDIFRDGLYHPGAPTIAAALATAQDRGTDGAAFLRAVVAGFEVSTRIATIINPSHYRNWHTTGTVGTIGAAAAVATLLGLDAKAAGHAIASSVTMAAGLQQAFRSDAMSKPLHAGHAAEAGAIAAFGAEEGLTGAWDILEGERGFGAAMSDDPDWSDAFAGLGSSFNITRMTFKNHAACGHTFAAIDAVLDLRDRFGLGPDDADRIRVSTYRTALEVAGNPDPKTEFEAKFSLPYCLAVALTDGSVRLRAFEDDRLESPAIRELMGRIEVDVDDDLDAAFPAQRGARVMIDFGDGRTETSLARTRKGDPDDPLTDDDITGKLIEVGQSGMGADGVRELGDRLWALAALDDMATLVVADEG